MPTRYFSLEKIERGTGKYQSKIVYAHLYEVGPHNTNRELVISATPDYILNRIDDAHLNVPNLSKALLEAYPVITGYKGDYNGR